MHEYDLRDLQLAELRMLKQFTDFLDENGVVYVLDGGTLLGAVRHGGFIPWDDDVDICMDVKNYRKLLRLADRLPEPLFLQNYRTDPKNACKWTRIRVNGTTAMTPWLSSLDYHAGVWMDVFAVYGLAKTGFGRALQRFADTALSVLLNKYWLEAAGRTVSRRMRTFYRILPERLRLFFARCAERLLMLDTGHGGEALSLCYHPDSEKAIPMPSAWFDPSDRVRLSFEGEAFYAPAEYEDMLAAYYGNWRELPPPEERRTHGDLIVDLTRDWRAYYTGLNETEPQ